MTPARTIGEIFHHSAEKRGRDQKWGVLKQITKFRNDETPTFAADGSEFLDEPRLALMKDANFEVAPELGLKGVVVGVLDQGICNVCRFPAGAMKLGGCKGVFAEIGVGREAADAHERGSAKGTECVGKKDGFEAVSRSRVPGAHLRRGRVVEKTRVGFYGGGMRSWDLTPVGGSDRRIVKCADEI